MTPLPVTYFRIKESVRPYMLLGGYHANIMLGTRWVDIPPYHDSIPQSQAIKISHGLCEVCHTCRGCNEAGKHRLLGCRAATCLGICIPLIPHSQPLTADIPAHHTTSGTMAA